MNWTKDKPTQPGNYQIRCMETDNQIQHVSVFMGRQGKLLMVHDDSIGATTLDSYHDGLTYLLWLGPLPLPPSTEPAPQSVMDGHEPWGHDLWKHLHDEHSLMLLESELQQIVRKSVPLVGDLSQVVVLDKAVVEKVTNALQYGSATSDKFTREVCREALASLNAGGADD